MTIKLSAEDFATRLRKLSPDMEKAVIRGLQSAAYRLEGMIPQAIADTRPHAPENTGMLAGSTYTTLTVNGALVGVDAPHAPFIEYGTRPHWPPVEPLIDWVQQRGLVHGEEEAKKAAWRVARKIAREGTEPRFFMARAFEDLKQSGIIDEEIRAELDEIK